MTPREEVRCMVASCSPSLPGQLLRHGPLNCSTWASGYVQGRNSWHRELLSTDLGY